MSRFRFPLWTTMALVGLVAVGLAALRSPTPLGACATYTAAMVLLLLSLLGTAFNRGERQRFWAAFAVFGWAYLGHALANSTLGPSFLLTSVAIDYLNELLVPIPPNTVVTTIEHPASYLFTQTAHSLALVFVALLGTLLVRVITTREDDTKPSIERP